MSRRTRRRYRPRPLLRWAKPTSMLAPDTLHTRLAGMINTSHPLAMPLALRVAAADIGGMRLIALRTGLNREALYRALAPDGNPTLITLDRVLAVFGLRLTASPIAGARAMPRSTCLGRSPTTRRDLPPSPEAEKRQGKRQEARPEARLEERLEERKH